MFSKKDYQRDKQSFLAHEHLKKADSECRTCHGRNDNHNSGLKVVKDANGNRRYVHTPCPETRR